MGLFSAFSQYIFNDCGPNRGFHSDFALPPHFNTVKIVIFPSKFWRLMKKCILAKMLCFVPKKAFSRESIRRFARIA